MATMTTLNAYAAADAHPGFIARVRHALAARAEYLQIHAELSGLSDRELADIGLVRHDIRAIARGAVHG